MKKCVGLLILMVFLTGCGAAPTFETVNDVYVAQVSAPVRRILLDLPSDATVMTMEGEDGSRLYLCKDYSVVVQTMEAGDLDRSMRQMSGFSRDDLTVMGTQDGDFRRYSFVWCCAGETGNQLAKGVIIDDGNYHYALTVMAPEDMAGELASQWQVLLDSFLVL